MQPTKLMPAAEYLRMSTEHQQYSLHNQADIIRRYATQHGFEVVQSYSDSAKSGLMLKNRGGLAQLLKDVVSKGDRFLKAILVYDVSRWGRFQDTDEAAHYEFLCKSAGIPIHYCAESFVNDMTMPSIVMKTLKRVMAAEYSRELSEKVFEGAKNISKLGFRLGGPAGYGLRRMLCYPDGTPRTILEKGERKDRVADRIVLVPGPQDEVECVRDIFRMLIEERKTCEQIASILNNRGTRYQGGSKWTDSSIDEILHNRKYAGWHVWGRFQKKLGGPKTPVPEQYWTKIPNAFQAIVSDETFALAQETLRRSLPDAELLARLRTLLAQEGRLSQDIINQHSDFPSGTAYRRRFGGLLKAYELIGYQQGKKIWDKVRARRIWHLRKELVAELQRLFPNQLSVSQKHPKNRPLLHFVSGPAVSIAVCPSTHTLKGAPRWLLPIPKKWSDYDRRMTLLCRCDSANAGFHDFYLFPRFERGRTLIAEQDEYLRMGKQVPKLALLQRIAQVMHIRRNRTAKRSKN